MDAIVLTERLESLRRCVQRIEEKQPQHIDQLKQNTRAVQLCIDIGSHILSHTNCPAPQTMGSVFTLLQEASVISSTTSQQLKKQSASEILQYTSTKQSTGKLFTQSANTHPRIFVGSHKKSAAMSGCNTHWKLHQPKYPISRYCDCRHSEAGSNPVAISANYTTRPPSNCNYSGSPRPDGLAKISLFGQHTKKTISR